jgi:hypothetical protein
MNFTSKAAIVGSGLMLAGAALAVTPTTQKAADYAVITTRNPFGLVPPPPKIVPVVEAPKKEAEPPPNVELTGIFNSTRRGKMVAFFMVERAKGEKKQSYSWGVGEGDDGMKVLAINSAERTVRLSVNNVESTITFSEKPVAPAVPVAPNNAAAGGPGRNRVIANNGMPTATQAAPQQYESTRRGGMGRPSSSMSAIGGGLPSQQGQANALQSVPSRQLRIPGNTSQLSLDQPNVQPLSPVEQEILIEVNREVLKANGQTQNFPPLPPTSMTTAEDLSIILAPPPVPNQ